MREEFNLFVGSYAEATQTGLYSFRFNLNGELYNLNPISSIENPSYICLNDDAKLLHAVSEFKEGQHGKLTTYKQLPNGSLEYLSEIWYEGAGSCNVSIDSEKRHLFIANYGAGSLTVLPLSKEGLPGTAIQTISFEGNGPNQERQDMPHIHAALLSPDETKLYCTDLGTDRIYLFDYDPTKPLPLSQGNPNFLVVHPGSGPRHMAFSANGNWMYVVCELNGGLFAFHHNDSACTAFQELYLREDAEKKNMEAADLQIHPDGRFLYASTRGDSNKIFVFEIDQITGLLTCVQYTSSIGESPRNLAIDPTGSFLLAANEQGSCITIFTIAEDGKLLIKGKFQGVNKPTCLKFASI